MARVLGIQIAGDYAAAPEIKEAVSGLAQLDEMGKKAAASIERLANQRANLKQLAVAYQAVADSAVKGSDEQVLALKKVSDAEARLAAQVKVSGAEMTAANRNAADHAAAIGGIGTSARKTEGLVSKLSGSMALWLGAPALGAGLASAIHGTQQFSAAMELLHTQAGASQAEVTRMTAALRKMAGAVGTGPAELATGLYHIESAGFRGTQALKILTAAAEGARLGNANLEDVTNALNAVVVSGIKGVKSYRQAMGELNATVGAGDMNMQQLADAMGTGLPARAAVYGVSLRDVSAALAVFGDNNIRGAKAGTDLASAIRLMAAPSKVAAKVLGDLGISATQLADDIRHQGLSVAISDLKTRMDALGLTSSQQGVILSRAFGGKQSTGIVVLVDQLERLRQKEIAVGQGGSKFSSDWQAYQRQSQFATQKFQASLETLRIEVGAAILPTFTKATDGLTKWIDKENKSGQLAKDMKTAIADLTGVLRTAHDVIHDVDKVTGSFKNTLEILLGVKVASVLSSWAGDFTTLAGSEAAGTGLAGANAKAAVLKSNLGALAGIGAIGIEVTIAEKFEHGDPLGLGNIWKSITGGGSLRSKIVAALTGNSGLLGRLASGDVNPQPNVSGFSGITGGAGQHGALATNAANSPIAGGALRSYIASAAKAAGLDPNAVLAVASAEGGFNGAIGDGGHAFGPFQMNNAGGVVTGMSAAAANAYASSPAGINAAIAAMAKLARGKTGLDAVAAIVHGYERPADGGAGDLARAAAYLGGGGTSSEAAIQSGVTGLTNGPGNSAIADMLSGTKAGAAKKPKVPPIITGAALLSGSLQNAIAHAKNMVTQSSGAVAAKWLKDELAQLDLAKKKLAATAGTGKQKTAIDSETRNIDSQIATVNKEITANLKAQATAIKVNAKASISAARSSIGSAFTQISDDARMAFEQATSDYITNTLGPQFYQGLSTPLETQLSSMQAADTANGLQDTLDTAKKQLDIDKQTAGVTADQLAADQTAITQAQRAIDENNLSIQATADRAKEDSDYAAAVKKYQSDRTLQEDRMTSALKSLATGVENGTQKLNGPGGLNDVLAQFGLSASSVATDDLSTLSTATQALAKVMAAEAVALAKVGDSKDARSAAAAAASILAGSYITTAISGHLGKAPPSQVAGGNILTRGAIPALAGGGDIRAAGLAYLHPGERVLPAQVVASPGGLGTATVVINVNAPNYVGDHRDLAAAIKSPQVREAVATSVILASRSGHIRQGDIRQ